MGRDIICENVQKMYIIHKVCTCPKTIVGLFMVPNPTLYIPTRARVCVRGICY